MCKQKRARTPRAGVCQVCSVDLASVRAKDYCFKKRVCPEHLAADAVILPGHAVMHRFCHQCGRFEPLTCFDGVRRSCRTRLVIRRVGPSALRRGSSRTRSSSVAERQQQDPAPADTHTDTAGAYAAASAGAAAAAAASAPAGNAPTDTSDAFAAAAAAADTASAPTDSPAVSLDATAAPAHFCSVLSVDAAPMQLRDQQGWSHSAAAGVALNPPLQQEQQQQQQQQQQPESIAGADFDEFLQEMMENELQQIMQQEQQQQGQQQAQAPASAHVGAVSPPAPVPSAAQSPVLLTSGPTGLYRTASTATAVSSTAKTSLGMPATSGPNVQAVQQKLFSDGMQTDGAVPATPAFGGTAAMAVVDRTSQRRQQLLQQAQQLLEEERQLRELTSAISLTAGGGLSMAGTLFSGGCLGAPGMHSSLVQTTATAPVGSLGLPMSGAGMSSMAGFVPIQAGNIGNGLARVLSVPPGFPPAAAGHLLAPGSLELPQQQQQLLLPQGTAAAAPGLLVGRGGMGSQEICELRNQLLHAKLQLQELKAAAESIVGVMGVSCDMSYTAM